MPPNPTYRPKPGLCRGIADRILLVLVVMAALLAACTSSDGERTTAADPEIAPGTAESTSRAPTTRPGAPTGSPTTAGTSTVTSPSAETFVASVSSIDADTAERMMRSWRPGCPVPLDELRLLELPHVTFGGETALGEMVIHQAYVEDVVAVFETLYAARYPIERMQLVDLFDADDDQSMAANNTSGFNCREVAGAPGVWSEHAYGRAIDINPIQNPYVRRDGSVVPPAGEAYVERDTSIPGLITDGDVVVEAFAAVGWIWGGTWSGSKDYQHFSPTGR